MRPLSSPPASLFDPSGLPAFGSFAGALPAIDWAPVKRSPLQALREKRWVYLTLASDDVHTALAVVNLGFATKVFAFVFDKAQRRVVARVDVDELEHPAAHAGVRGRVERLEQVP